MAARLELWASRTLAVSLILMALVSLPVLKLAVWWDSRRRTF